MPLHEEHESNAIVQAKSLPDGYQGLKQPWQRVPIAAVAEQSCIFYTLPSIAAGKSEKPKPPDATNVACPEINAGINATLRILN